MGIHAHQVREIMLDQFDFYLLRIVSGIILVGLRVTASPRLPVGPRALCCFVSQAKRAALRL